MIWLAISQSVWTEQKYDFSAVFRSTYRYILIWRTILSESLDIKIFLDGDVMVNKSEAIIRGAMTPRVLLAIFPQSKTWKQMWEHFCEYQRGYKEELGD